MNLSTRYSGVGQTCSPGFPTSVAVRANVIHATLPLDLFADIAPKVVWAGAGRTRCCCG